MKRQTLLFDDESLKLVEEYRAKERPIPNFQEAVLQLIKKGAKSK